MELVAFAIEEGLLSGQQNDEEKKNEKKGKGKQVSFKKIKEKKSNLFNNSHLNMFLLEFAFEAIHIYCFWFIFLKLFLSLADSENCFSLMQDSHQQFLSLTELRSFYSNSENDTDYKRSLYNDSMQNNQYSVSAQQKQNNVQLTFKALSGLLEVRQIYSTTNQLKETSKPILLQYYVLFSRIHWKSASHKNTHYSSKVKPYLATPIDNLKPSPGTSSSLHISYNQIQSSAADLLWFYIMMMILRKALYAIQWHNKILYCFADTRRAISEWRKYFKSSYRGRVGKQKISVILPLEEQNEV
ncbi:hypothetical protein GQX74_015481 [Glossina fuscipes]|nr:hypothetical protein GQX74_015481 [Glossina fuscipes]